MSDVTVTPGRRFADPAELLSLADLNDAGSPIMQLTENSVGLAELIAGDVEDIITDQLIGKRVRYTTANDVTIVNTGLNLEFAKADMPEAEPGDPVLVSQLEGINLEINVTVIETGKISLRAYAPGSSTVIPAGSVFSVINLTAKRILAPGPVQPPLEDTGATGYLEVTAGYEWDRDPQTGKGEPITTAKLDMTAQPSAALKALSIGRRELDPAAVAALAAAVVSGTAFTLVAPGTYVLAPHTGLTFFRALAGSTVGQVPVLHGGPVFWSGVVNPAGTLRVSIWNATNTTQTIPAGTSFSGRLL